MISHPHASPIEKTCPVVTRQHQGHCEILAFADPQAGHQFVKGTLEPSESAAAAARRELREEAGITEIKTTIVLGQSTTIHPGELWHFFWLETAALPDHWHHSCGDDRGHLFKFFWRRMEQPLGDEFDPRYHKDLAHICATTDLKARRPILK